MLKNLEKVKFLIVVKKLNLLERINKTEGLPISKLHQEIYLCYGTANSVLKIFERDGLVETKWVGRKRNACITEKGKRVLKNLKVIENALT